MKRAFVRVLKELSSRPNRRMTLVVVLALVTGITLAMAASRGQQKPDLLPSGFALGDQIVSTISAPQEAQVGFDGAPNGFVDALVHQSDQMAFEEQESADGKLGPLYNAQSCRECHGSPVTGGISQITELRAGFQNRFGQFINPDVTIGHGSYVVKGRSLINDRAVCPSAAFPSEEIQEHVPEASHASSVRSAPSQPVDARWPKHDLLRCHPAAWWRSQRRRA